MNSKKTWVNCKNLECRRIKHIERTCICGFVETEEEETNEEVTE